MNVTPLEDFEEVFTKNHFIEILEALHMDQTGMSASLYKIKEAIQGWRWATECRGCYEWDDDAFYKEFENCLDSLNEIAVKGLRDARKAHQICCNKYRHIVRDPGPVQMELDLGMDYGDFVEGILNLTTIEGA